MATAGAGIAPPIADASGRAPELQDALNRRVYHPLARALARRLHPTGVSPHAVSIAGMLLVWGAAHAYTRMGWPEGVLIGFALHLLWHVVDGADGDLARLTGKSSPMGELVDGGAALTMYVSTPPWRGVSPVGSAASRSAATISLIMSSKLVE